MGMFDSFNISSTGLTAQRLRMDIISSNIANASTTRTPEGGPYRRKRALFGSVNLRPNYKSAIVPKRLEHGNLQGVRVLKIEEDMSPLVYKYDPTHKDAIQTGPKKGMVAMPNVKVVTEMTDLITASRSYEANVTMINNSKAMYSKALEIGRIGV